MALPRCCMARHETEVKGISRPPHLLLFEPDPRGHAREWLGHLVSYARRRGGLRLSLLVAPELAPDLNRMLRDTPGFSDAAVEVYALGRWQASLCTHHRLVISALARWWAMCRWLYRLDADYGCFLCIDHLSLPLALRLPGAGRRLLCGILFRPSVHYSAFDTTPATWRERLREVRKQVLYRRMLAHNRLVQVWSLDPYFPDYAAANYPAGDKVTPLVDPAFRPPVPTAEDTRIAGRVPGERVFFLMFGVMTARKGVLRLLEALAQLPPTAAEHAAVLIAGELDPEIRADAVRAVKQLGQVRPRLWIDLEDRHLRSGEIAALIRRCDIVLAPYQRFVGSSGALMWAAAGGRPVITQAYGLLGQLVRNFGLGLAVDTTDPRALAAALRQAITSGPEALATRAALTSFVADRTPDRFAGTILNPVANGVWQLASAELRRTAPERRPE